MQSHLSYLILVSYPTFVGYWAKYVSRKYIIKWLQDGDLVSLGGKKRIKKKEIYQVQV